MKADVRITTPDGEISITSKDVQGGTAREAVEDSFYTIVDYLGDKDYIVTGEFAWDGVTNSVTVDFLITNDHVKKDI